MNTNAPIAPPPVVRRPSGRLWIFTGVLVLVAGGVTLGVLQPWRKPPPVQTQRLGSSLELAAGEVLLVSGGKSERLLSGTPLPADAVVKTGAGARAMIRLSDGSRVFLRDETTVSLGAGVGLESGQIWLEAPPLEEGQEGVAHRIGETSVSLSDGGASLSRSGDSAQIYVAEGLAIVSASGGRAEVKAGEQANIAADGAPKVTPVAFWDDWTGGMGDRGGGGLRSGVGSGALYAVDRGGPPGAPALPLAIQRQTVKIAIEGDLAETLVDQRFFNPSSKPVEGWYWFTIPEGSQLVSFALETNGQLVEGEIVERKQAAATYEAAIRRDNDPALLEWIDARTVRARIYPVPALGERRVVLRYQQMLTESEGKLRYRYPLSGPPGREAAAIEEFSLEVQLRGGLEKDYTLATLGEARVEPDNKRVTMRRSGYTPRADFEIELTRKPEKERVALRYNLLDPGGDQARFVMVRYAPDLDFSKLAMPRGDVVVVVDTSAAGDPSEQQTKLAVAEALLRSLSAGDRFAVMSADVTATVLYPPEGLAEATPDAISSALEKVAQHASGGATDLGAIFEQALARVHGLEQPAVVYIGDGLATSGERAGDALAERLRRSMTGSRARLFTVGVGSEIDSAMLGRLARVGGGESLRVDAPEQAVVRALELSGALKTPTITDLEVEVGEGLDDVFISAGGKLSRGQEMVLLARTHHDLPSHDQGPRAPRRRGLRARAQAGPRGRRARQGGAAPVGRRLRRAPARRHPRRRGRARQDPLARPRVRDDDPLHVLPLTRQRVRLRPARHHPPTPQLRRRQAHRRLAVDPRRRTQTNRLHRHARRGRLGAARLRRRQQPRSPQRRSQPRGQLATGVPGRAQPHHRGEDRRCGARARCGQPRDAGAGRGQGHGRGVGAHRRDARAIASAASDEPCRRVGRGRRRPQEDGEARGQQARLATATTTAAAARGRRPASPRRGRRCVRRRRW